MRFCPRPRSPTSRLRRPISDFHCRIGGGGTQMVGNSPIAASRASLSASSRSVLRLTFFHCQAAPVVLATRQRRPSSLQVSRIHPAGEHASITTHETGSRRISRSNSARVVLVERNVAALLAGSYQQQTLLNLPRSMAKMGSSIACLRQVVTRIHRLH